MIRERAQPVQLPEAPELEPLGRAAPLGTIWWNVGFTVISGLLLTGAMPNLDWGWLAWIALAPFLLLFPFNSNRTAFAYGLLLAAIYAAGLVYWVVPFASHPIGPTRAVMVWAIAALCESIFFGAWAAGAQWLRASRNPWAWRLGAPALWVIVVEWLRQLGPLGISWGDLAYTQHAALPILQLTKLTGIWGVSFLIVLVNVVAAETIRKRRVGRFLITTAVLVALTLACGQYALRAERLHPSFVAAALQGNIDQNVPHDEAYARRVVSVYSNLSREAASRGTVLTVWPETAYPGYLLNDDQIDLLWDTKQTARRYQEAAVIGSAERDKQAIKDWNTLFLMTPSGDIDGRYRKRQLVPFGEYAPASDWLPALQMLQTIDGNNYESGADVQPLIDAGPTIGKLGAAVCFESSYPELTREQVSRGAGLLVVSTDDTWFGRTAEVRQHTAVAAVRAAETDRYLVRSAATGVSEIIDPTGKVIVESPLLQPAVVSAPVESRATLTPYVRWGNWFVALCGLILGVIGAATAMSSRHAIWQCSNELLRSVSVIPKCKNKNPNVL